MIYLADGTPVPESAVKALEDLERRWPGATLPQARAAIAAAVLGTVTEEWGVSSDMAVDGIDTHPATGPTTVGGTEVENLTFVRKYGGHVWGRIVSPWAHKHYAARPAKARWPEQPETIEAEALRQDS